MSGIEQQRRLQQQQRRRQQTRQTLHLRTFAMNTTQCHVNHFDKY